ncbi:MAG: hypothetical protein NXI32_12165 [bacterium]|nr:hypothetical protein [bacterium]
MPRPNEDDREAYRCSVSPENAAAQLKVGGKLHLVAVLDTSRNGFTVRMDHSTAQKLKGDGPYDLYFSGEHWEVQKESHFDDGELFTNVGFSRVRERTKVEEPHTAWWQVWANRQHANSDPAFLLYLMLAFLFACIALPGVGDSLGTAPRIRKGVHVIWDMVSEMIF